MLKYKWCQRVTVEQRRKGKLISLAANKSNMAPVEKVPTSIENWVLMLIFTLWFLKNLRWERE